jgi:hypothetical protein
VKFAKSKPLDYEIEEIKIKYKKKAFSTLDSSIPVEVEIEEEILNEAQKQNRFKFN